MVDGVVVYLNGIELWRKNINSGPVTALNMSTVAVTDEVSYLACTSCKRGNFAQLQVELCSHSLLSCASDVDRQV